MRLGKKRHIFCRQKSQETFFRSLSILFCVSFVIGCLWYFFMTIRPAFITFAENRAKELAVLTIHQTVSETIGTDSASHNEIVEFAYAADNRINAVKSNLAGISRLKSDLNLRIMNSISAMDSDTLKIPLGSLLGSELFSGLGPSVSFRIKPYGTAVTDIRTDFSEAGINQTKLDVTVDVTADLSVFMPTVRKKSRVETSVPIIQTVIVGDIPESYTHVDRDGYEFEDDVLELAE